MFRREQRTWHISMIPDSSRLGIKKHIIPHEGLSYCHNECTHQNHTLSMMKMHYYRLHKRSLMYDHNIHQGNWLDILHYINNPPNNLNIG